MRITLNRNVASKIPTLKIGLIHYNKIIVEDSPQMIKGRMQFYQENLVMELMDQAVTEREGIKEWRTLWKELGADPNRYRHSAESLIRRIAKQNYLTPVHSAVDLNNFFSIMHEIPIGIYDVNKLNGDLEIALGDVETGYEGLNGRFNKLENILFSCDSVGPFGSPYVDSARTAVTTDTVHALQIFYLRPSLSEENCQKLLQAAGAMFTQVSGGDYKVALLTANEQEAQF